MLFGPWFFYIFFSSSNATNEEWGDFTSELQQCVKKYNLPHTSFRANEIAYKTIFRNNISYLYVREK